MKKVIVLVMLIFSFCYGCRQNAEKKEQNAHVPVLKYIMKDSYLYEAKPAIYPVLDSVICHVNSIEKYKSKMHGYIFTVTQDSSIFVTALDYWAIFLKYGDARFYYKGYKFSYDGMFLEDYFIKIRQGKDLVIDEEAFKKDRETYYESRSLDDISLTIITLGEIWRVWQYQIFDDKIDFIRVMDTQMDVSLEY